jgi:hypothetical protein
MFPAGQLGIRTNGKDDVNRDQARVGQNVEADLRVWCAAVVGRDVEVEPGRVVGKVDADGGTELSSTEVPMETKHEAAQSRIFRHRQKVLLSGAAD